jgi:hypothetical protein
LADCLMAMTRSGGLTVLIMVSTKTEPESGGELKVLKEQIEMRAYHVEPTVVADAILRRLAELSPA